MRRRNRSTEHRVNSSVYFDGVNDYFSNFSFFFGTHWGHTVSTPFFLSVWIRPDSVSTRQCICAKYDWVNAANAKGWAIDILSTGALFFVQVSTLLNSVNAQTAPNAVTAGVWNHVVVVHDGSTQPLFTGYPKIYVNGVDTGAATGYATPPVGNTQNGVEFTVGAREFNSNSVSIFYKGYMCEMIYGTSFSPSSSEVRALYNGGRPPDITRDGTIYREVLLSDNVNKWMPFQSPTALRECRFSIFGVDWNRNIIGSKDSGNFVEMAVNQNYSLLENGGPVSSYKRPGRL